MGPSTWQSFMESVAFVHHYKMTFSFARICPSSGRLYYDSYSYGLSGKRTSSTSSTIFTSLTSFQGLQVLQDTGFTSCTRFTCFTIASLG